MMKRIMTKMKTMRSVRERLKLFWHKLLHLITKITMKMKSKTRRNMTKN